MEETQTLPTQNELRIAELEGHLERERNAHRSLRSAIARDFDSLQMAIREMDDEDADRLADLLNSCTSVFDEFTVQEEHEITVSVTIRVMARTEDDARREVQDGFDVKVPFDSEWDVDFDVD